MSYAGIVEMIDQYYNCTRQAGHTWVPLSQLGSDAIYVVTTEQEVRNLLYPYPHKNPFLAKIVSLERLDENLLGMNGPLIFDHFAMMNLIHWFKEELKHEHGNRLQSSNVAASQARSESRKLSRKITFLESQLDTAIDKMTSLVEVLKVAGVNVTEQENHSWAIERPATEKDKGDD